jgi:hypothetical protein
MLRQGNVARDLVNKAVAETKAIGELNQATAANMAKVV